MIKLKKKLKMQKNIYEKKRPPVYMKRWVYTRILLDVTGNSKC